MYHGKGDVKNRPKHLAYDQNGNASSTEANLVDAHERNESIHAKSATGDVHRSRSGKDAHASDVVEQPQQGNAEYSAILSRVSEARCPSAAEDLIHQKINYPHQVLEQLMDEVYLRPTVRWPWW